MQAELVCCEVAYTVFYTQFLKPSLVLYSILKLKDIHNEQTILLALHLPIELFSPILYCPQNQDQIRNLVDGAWLRKSRAHVLFLVSFSIEQEGNSREREGGAKRIVLRTDLWLPDR